jgi:hypothetical protein
MTTEPRHLKIEEIGQLKTLIEGIGKNEMGVFSGGREISSGYKYFQFSFGDGYRVKILKGKIKFRNLFYVNCYTVKVFVPGSSSPNGEMFYSGGELYDVNINSEGYLMTKMLDGYVKSLYKFMKQKVNLSQKNDLVTKDPHVAERELKDLIDKK